MSKYKITSTLTVICQQVWVEPSLDKGKQIMIDHVNSTGIKDVDKKRIITAVNMCATKRRLDQYMANSILMFEGMGLNKKITESKPISETVEL
jgi:hypothetical protein